MITTSPITPTIGRIVYVHSAPQLGIRAQPVPAIVNAVHDDPNVVGVTVLPPMMPPFSIPNLPYAEPEGDEPMPEHGWWWMPYQRQMSAAATSPDPDDAPELTDRNFETAAVMDGDTVVREATETVTGKPAKAKDGDADTPAPEEPSTAS